MQESVLTPIDFDTLDLASRKWLQDLGLSRAKCILGFDCTKETVTFLINGESVERQVAQIWTRVMGYHRPVAYFNVGKKAEHAERRFFRTDATEAKLRQERAP